VLLLKKSTQKIFLKFSLKVDNQTFQIMETFQDFRTFKTEKCQEKLCPCYKQTSDNFRPPDDFAECFYYHNHTDQRRDPLNKDPIPTIQYEHYYSNTQYIKPERRECLNLIEYLYHPKAFKTTPCIQCRGYFCPDYHNEEEKDHWHNLLRVGRDLDHVSLSRIDVHNDKSVPSTKDGDSQIKNRLMNVDNDSLMFSHRSDTNNTSIWFGELINNLEEESSLKSHPKPISINENSKQNTTVDSQKSNKSGDSKGGFSGQFFIEESISKQDPQKGFSGQFYLESHQTSATTAPVKSISTVKVINHTIKEEEKTSSNQIVNIKEYSTANQLPSALNGYAKPKPVSVPVSVLANVNINTPKKAEPVQIVHVNHQSNKPPPIQEIKPITTEVPRVQNIEAVETQVRLEKKRETDVNLLGILNSKNGLPFTIGTKIYIYKETVDIAENMHHEFKHFKITSIDYIEGLIEKYVTSFLNSQGGTLYLGINDDGLALGIRLDRKLFDEIAIAFDRKLKHFTPPVRADQYQIRANYIYDKRAGTYLTDHYILEIEIKKGDPADLYFNDKKDSFIRKQASSIVLQPAAIK